MFGCRYSNPCFACGPLLEMMAGVPKICKACLLTAVHVSKDCELPDHPQQYLATALQHARLECQHVRNVARDEVIGSAESLQKDDERLRQRLRAALRQLAEQDAPRQREAMSELEALLVSEGLPARASDDHESFMCMAASSNNVAALELLCAFGGNLNEVQVEGCNTQTALERSSALGHLEVASLLLSKGGKRPSS